jgi:uncharacterized FlaG/YvyC family protein
MPYGYFRVGGSGMKVNAISTQITKLQSQINSEEKPVTKNSEKKTHPTVNTNEPSVSNKQLNNESVQHKIEIEAQELALKFHDNVGLIQSIISERLTADIIRKMPSDEYIDLLKLAGEYVDGLIDKEI